MTDDPTWKLTASTADRDSAAESRFAIGNGLLGVRDALLAPDRHFGHPAVTYVAGLFDTRARDGAVPELVPAPDWLRLRMEPDGQALSPALLTLDLRRGALTIEARYRFGGAVVRMRETRLVSLHDRSLGLQVVHFEMLSGSGTLELDAGFGPAGSLLTKLDDGLWRTAASDKRLSVVASARLWVDGAEQAPPWRWDAYPGQIARFARLVAFGRDRIVAVPDICAWRNVLHAHEAAWAERWVHTDVAIAGDPAAQQAVRFAAYHLIAAANPDDDFVSIGARSLTGEDYRGHVFWDTEIYLLPFYTLTWPAAARALLMYRFHTLDGARAKAAGMGWKGALYAWESTDTGFETTPDQVRAPDGRMVDVLCGRLEQHISADVAYAVWSYWQATGDDAFVRDAGAEILLETGRFWASRAALGDDGLYHIRGVIGPDEFHEYVDDSVYTNAMARWNITRALRIADWLREHHPGQWRRLVADAGELAAWRKVADSMAILIDPVTGVLEQFAGYFGHEEIDLAAYSPEQRHQIDIVLGKPRIQGSKLVKQADVVALLALLPEEFAPGTERANFEYYLARCSHSSSLSPATHGLVAARLGDPEMALAYFRQTAAIDLAETIAHADRGVHIAAQGGVWMLAALGFAGISTSGGKLSIAPNLPAEWDSLALEIQWRGRTVQIRADHAATDVSLARGENLTVVVNGAERLLQCMSGA